MSKKTISVAFLLEKANNMLANSTSDLVGAREETANFISDALSQTGNYKGFMYLFPEKDNSGFYGKECRVFFYVSDTLKEEYARYAEMRKAE